MKRWIQILIALLFLDSVGIFWIWGVALVDGAFQDGLFAYQEGNIPIFHLTAEFGMALVTLAGLYGWWHDRSWGRGITLLGMGMFTYSAVNSMGWAIHNDVALAIPMIATLLLVLIAVPMLLRSPHS